MTYKNKWIAVSGNGHELSFEIGDHYTISYNGQPVKFDISEQPDGFLTISAFGVRYPVEVLSRHQNHYQVLVNGVQYAFSVETPFSLKRQKLLSTLACIGTRKTIVKAPMPGKISKIGVTAGQDVCRTDMLLVLDAMKMQNAILSQDKGTVTKIWVQEGQTVAKDEKLMEIG
ncbi:MAG: hypothetical protein QM786_09125 [Breznakibacter sp.]